MSGEKLHRLSNIYVRTFLIPEILKYIITAPNKRCFIFVSAFVQGGVSPCGGDTGQPQESRGQRAEAHSLACISQLDQEAREWSRRCREEGVPLVMGAVKGPRGSVGHGLVSGRGWSVSECFGGHLPCPAGSQSLALGPRSLCLQLPEASSSAGLLARPPPWLPWPHRTQVCVWHHMQLRLPPPPSEVPVTRAPSA